MSLLNHKTCIIHPDFTPIKDYIVSLPGRFANGEGTTIYKGRNELRLFEHNGYRLVVKSFRRPNIINRCVYGFLRKSKAKRSYDNALKLLSIGIGTPIPVGYLNIRAGLLFDQSYYISLESSCSHIYNDLFFKDFDYREEVLRSIGLTTAILHEHGYAHKDYGRANILFEKTPEGINIELVDLNRMAIGPLDIKAGCKNFERLPATPQMHRWMAEEYARKRNFDTETCFRLMSYYRSTQPGKIDDKY